MSAPVLAFANYAKEFLLETNASKEGLGEVLSKKQADGRYHLVAYGSQALTAHEKKLPFHQTWVPGAKMGNYKTFQGVLAISTLLI